jgi:hypothetical protein
MQWGSREGQRAAHRLGSRRNASKGEHDYRKWAAEGEKGEGKGSSERAAVAARERKFLL